MGRRHNGIANEGGVKENFHSLHIWGRNLKVYEVYKVTHFIIGAGPEMSVFISSFYSFFLSFLNTPDQG